MSPLQFLPTLKRWVSLEGFYDEYKDEYHCNYCKLSFEILLINETGKEVVDKGKVNGNDNS